MELKYRIGTCDDIDQLQELALLSYGQHKSALTEENWDKFHSFLANRENFSYLIKTSTCILCEYNTEIVGMAYLVSNGHPTEMFKSEWSYIRMVGVNPQFGGKGIAKKLTKMCIDLANETKEEFIALHTSEFMDAARHIYESIGFKQVQEIDLRFGKKYWIYLLNLRP